MGLDLGLWVGPSFGLMTGEHQKVWSVVLLQKKHPNVSAPLRSAKLGQEPLRE